MGEPVGVNSAVIIYLLESNPKFIEIVRPLFRSIRDGKQKATLSIIGLIEILTGAKKQKRYKEAYQYRQRIKQFPNLTIANLNDNIVEIASDLRAKYGIATPDAIHVATAIDAGASKFITNDQRLKEIKEIKVETLK